MNEGLTVPATEKVPAGDSGGRGSLPLLQVRGVSVAGNALENLDLDIFDGEFLCVAGPAGCGKTALMRTLAGLISPQAGTVFLHGRPVAWGAIAAGVTPAEDSLFPWLSVRENLWLALRVGGVGNADPWRVDSLLGLAGLLPFANRFPRRLPPPTRRIVELCRALVRDPALVLLDEPFHGLDGDDRMVLAGELERLWGVFGKTLVLFTRDIGLGLRLADRVAVLAGRPARIADIVPVPLARPRRPLPAPRTGREPGEWAGWPS